MSLMPGLIHLPSKWTSTPKESWQGTPGAYPPSPNPQSSPNHQHHLSIAESVRARKDDYVKKKTIKLKVGTWNVASMRGTDKDLGGWFTQGLGIRGLHQDLAGHKADDDSPLSSDSEVESIEHQEARAGRKSSTLPEHDRPAIASGTEVDLYVLGLQEVVDISSMTEAVKPFTNPNPARKWKKALKQSLPRGYRKVVEHQLLGLLLLVYASPRLAPEISSVSSTSVGTGLMGYLGNKGAVATRLLIGESTRMVFVNSHLASGTDGAAVDRRNWDTQQIMSRTKFSSVGDEWVGGIGQPESIGDEDFCFWFGDLNSRLGDIPGEDVRRLLLLHTRNEYDVLNKSKRKIDGELGFLDASAYESVNDQHYDHDAVERSAANSEVDPPLDPQHDPASLYTTLKALLKHDQLHDQQRRMKVFHEGWREGEINFLPTYKYDVGSVAMFDSGEKKRSPSWCDRILYRTRADYEAYQSRSRQSLQARERDADMHRRGIDDAAQQENVLFDYDPNDDQETQTEYDENGNTAELIQTVDGFEGEISIEEYVSHQRVLSSDHKPLSAVFSLTYDSVDQTLKAKVQQEVVRGFDKAENEARPNITLVYETFHPAHANADPTSDDSGLNLIDFGVVKYDAPVHRQFTIANTGPMTVLLAFVAKPNEPEGDASLAVFPSWLTVHTERQAQLRKSNPSDPDAPARYSLEPGDTMDVHLSLRISDTTLVKKLNAGHLLLDDILVLRVSNGRDYFIPIRANWLQSCFFRTLDELVRVPSGGVRSLSFNRDGTEVQRKISNTVYHSAPQELFILTEAIPPLVERVIADWNILNVEGNSPLWSSDHAVGWPFRAADEIKHDGEGMIALRDALDMTTSMTYSDEDSNNAALRLDMVATTLIHFLESLVDGIVPAEVWRDVETSVLGLEKSARDVDNDGAIQDVVMEVLSRTPVHNVSMTFVVFMLGQVITTVCAANTTPSPTTVQPMTRTRSSTSASAMSNVSLSSISSSTTITSKTSLLTSLTRRTGNSESPTNRSATTEPRSKKELIHDYATIFAPILIRSTRDPKLKARNIKEQNMRKIRVLKVLLTMPP